MVAEAARTYQALVIPGLLQTREYARLATRAGGVVEEEEIERHVEARMMRKQILADDPAPRIWAIIDEAALATTGWFWPSLCPRSRGLYRNRGVRASI